MARKMTKAEMIAERDDAIAELRKMLKVGDRIGLVLKHVSSSGMSRNIVALVPYTPTDLVYPMKGDGQRDYDATPKRVKGRPAVRDISYLVARACERPLADKGGVTMTGAGMDMGFALVYDLGQTLWPNGTRKPHGRRNGEPDHTGGYALKHDWL